MHTFLAFVLLFVDKTWATISNTSASRFGTSSVVRTNNERNYDTARKLDWIFIQKVIENDKYYTWYDRNEIPNNVNEMKDREDFLRDTDICPDPRVGTYSRENCPTPPECENIRPRWGSAKLCINRVPLPFDENQFYIAAMKCIPSWENCDKCMCGQITGNTINDQCFYRGRHVPDDDSVQVDCYDLTKIKISGNVFRPFSFKQSEETIQNSEILLSTSSQPSAPLRTTIFPKSEPTFSLSQTSEQSNVQHTDVSTTTPRMNPSSLPSQSITPYFTPRSGSANTPMVAKELTSIPSITASTKSSVIQSTAPTRKQGANATATHDDPRINATPSKTPTVLESSLVAPSDKSKRPVQVSTASLRLAPAFMASVNPSYELTERPAAISASRTSVSPLASALLPENVALFSPTPSLAGIRSQNPKILASSRSASSNASASTSPSASLLMEPILPTSTHSGEGARSELHTSPGARMLVFVDQAIPCLFLQVLFTRMLL